MFMYIHDSHVHTKYSFDGAKDERGEVDTIVATAIKLGLNEISLCDHCDIDDIIDGIYPPFEADAARADILAAKEKYGEQIHINYGIELGQTHVYPNEAKAFLKKYSFDFVIGSLHNLRGYPDYYFLKFESMCPEQLEYIMNRTLNELDEIIDFGQFSTLAHITYIQRYLSAAGVPFEFKRYADRFESIFKKLISKNIALEVNTSGLRKGDITMPGQEPLALYKDCGGELITIGSDAHSADDIGKGIAESADMLRELGFKSQCIVRGGKLVQTEL